MPSADDVREEVPADAVQDVPALAEAVQSDVKAILTKAVDAPSEDVVTTTKAKDLTAEIKSLAASCGMSEAEVWELKEIFSLVDLDGGGTISKDELATLMDNLGLEASKAETENLINEIDYRDTGEIEFDNFVKTMSRKVETSATPERLKWAFRKFQSVNGPANGVTMNVLIEALSEYGEPSKRLSRADAASLILQNQPNLKPDDVFDFNAYIDLMFSK